MTAMVSSLESRNSRSRLRKPSAAKLVSYSRGEGRIRAKNVQAREHVRGAVGRTERESAAIRSRVHTGAWSQGECASNAAEHLQSYLLLPFDTADGAPLCSGLSRAANRNVAHSTGLL